MTERTNVSPVHAGALVSIRRKDRTSSCVRDVPYCYETKKRQKTSPRLSPTHSERRRRAGTTNGSSRKTPDDGRVMVRGPGHRYFLPLPPCRKSDDSDDDDDVAPTTVAAVAHLYDNDDDHVRAYAF